MYFPRELVEKQQDSCCAASPLGNSQYVTAVDSLTVVQ